LHYAIQSGDVETVKALLVAGSNVDIKNKGGQAGD
jgi:ankyrin repeat protein